MEENLLQDIWKTHTDVQEQMLYLRMAPIGIIPESAKIVGEKLYLILDENEGSDSILQEIKSLFDVSLDYSDIEKGFFLADPVISQKIDKNQKMQLAQNAASHFVKFHPAPVIDGFIKKKTSTNQNLQDALNKHHIPYSFDRKNRLQITVSDLKTIIEYIKENKLSIQIPEVASVILSIRPNPMFYLIQEFPGIRINHKTLYYRKLEVVGHEEIEMLFCNRTIELFGGYFNAEIEKDLFDKIGLSLIGYEYTFHINPEVFLHHSTLNFWDYEVNSNNSTLIVRKNLRERNKDMEEKKQYDKLISGNIKRYDWDFDFVFSLYKRKFSDHFGSNNIYSEIKFIYSYDTHKAENFIAENQDYNQIEFWRMIYATFANQKVSIGESSNTLGIDFNWQTEDLTNVISKINNQCPFINFSFYLNHKCNIDFKIQDDSLSAVEASLRDKFPSIQVSINNRDGKLYFFQEYLTREQSSIIREMIKAELEEIDSNAFDCGLFEIPINKEKYILSIDDQSKRESLQTAIKELRGATFCINKMDFGKLIRINYPEVTFDISGDNFEKTKFNFSYNNISSIEPNLSGEIEKIYRLKKSLENISSGKNLQNPNLKEFIFNAAKATIIDDIEYHIDPNSETYRDLDFHLLNKSINAPQKQAIIKMLMAKDLALIQGPPGTGKSTAIAEIIWQHIRKNPQERILLTSETNLAVDNAIDRIVNENHNLVKPIRIGDEEKLEMEGKQFSLDLMKTWVENGAVEFENEDQEEDSLPQKLILQNWIENIQRRVAKTAINNVSFDLWNNLIQNPTKEIRTAFFNQYLNNCNVIGATCSSIGEKNTRNRPTSFYKSYYEIFGRYNKKSIGNSYQHSTSKGGLAFTTVIQDESSKATPAELSLPLVYGKKNIVIGDHRQLPPLLDKEEFMLSFDFLLDKTENEDDRRKIQRLKSFVNKHFTEMEISHFERLFERIDNSLKGIFNLQYRMHPDINDVIRQFYKNDGGLDCGLVTPVDLGVNDHNLMNPASRFHGIEIEGFISSNNHVIWIDTKTPEILDGTSRVNYGEVDVIRDVLTKFQNSDTFQKFQSFWKSPEDQQIGIISFYGKQIRLLRNLRNEFRAIPMRISTVDRFQGMERNIIIVSMVRSNRIAADKNQKADINLYGELGFTEQKDLGFAQSPNRLNVALSRAKRLLIIVGNSELFRQKPIYDNVYTTIENNPNGRIIKYNAK